MKLLIIESEHAASAWFADRLVPHGFMPESVESVQQALRKRLHGNARAVIIDIGSGGAHSVRALRQAGVDLPVMVLCARVNWRETIDCFDAGADDHLVKPVRSEEIAARLRALIRRSAGKASDKIVLADIQLDIKARCAWRAGTCLDLTRNEFRLLRMFLLDPGRIMTHAEIRDQLYSAAAQFSQNALEVQIARLRRKVGRERIRTIRGIGYQYVTGFASPCEPGIEPQPGSACGCRCGANVPAAAVHASPSSAERQPTPADAALIQCYAAYI